MKKVLITILILVIFSTTLFVLVGCTENQREAPTWQEKYNPVVLDKAECLMKEEFLMAQPNHNDFVGKKEDTMYLIKDQATYDEVFEKLPISVRFYNSIYYERHMLGVLIFNTYNYGKEIYVKDISVNEGVMVISLDAVAQKNDDGKPVVPMASAPTQRAVVIRVNYDETVKSMDIQY